MKAILSNIQNKIFQIIALLPILYRIMGHPKVLFVAFTIIGTYIFYLRFPNNFHEPNFYAEDGSVFF